MDKPLDLCTLTFTPYIGDTFLATALARKINEVTLRDVAIVQIDAEHHYAHHFCREEDRIFIHLGGALGELISVGKNFSPEAPLHKIYYKGQFNYFYASLMEHLDYLAMIEDITNRAITHLNPDGVLYSFHYTFPHAFFAREAKRKGIEVRGYILDDAYNLKMINHRGEMVDAVIWTDEFIGQRLCREFLGCDLTAEDFDINITPIPFVHPTKVTLFPGTRGSGLPTAGHWVQDVEYLRRQGYDVVMATMESDDIDTAPFVAAGARLDGFSSIKEMIAHITTSQFIVCNDSSAFHFAWYFGVPAIVKQKGGFNDEWIPEWIREDPCYPLMPPVMMYEEEYTYLLDYGVNEIRSVRRASRTNDRH
jgi:hypothetical protein